VRTPWVHFLAPLALGGHGLHGICGPAYGPQHGAGRHGLGPALLLRHGRGDRAFRLHGRLVQPQQYSLLGAMRAVAQMISYEVVLLLSSVAVVNDHRLALAAQDRPRPGHVHRHLPALYIFTPWGLAGFLMYAIAARPRPIARRSICPRANRSWSPATTPSIPASSSRFLSRRVFAMFSISGLGTTLFLGGWSAPLSFLQFIPSWFWFSAK